MISMSKACSIRQLRTEGDSIAEISRIRCIVPQSVKKVRDTAEEKGMGWSDIERMDEREVYDLLFPQQAEAESACMQPDYDYEHKELQRDGVTPLILYAKLRDQAAVKGLACKSYGTFFRSDRECVVAKNVTNHLVHKPGQVMEGIVQKSRQSRYLALAGTADASLSGLALTSHHTARHRVQKRSPWLPWRRLEN